MGNKRTNGRALRAPTIGKIINQTKGYITKQLGKSIWQKLYYDEVIKNKKHYNEVWEYIEKNAKYVKNLDV